MHILFFIINAAFFLFSIRALNLASTKHVSMPGVYYCLSFLPIISLLSYDFKEKTFYRIGIDDYLIAITLHTVLLSIGIFLSYLLFNKGKVPCRDYSFSLNRKEKFSRFDWLLFVSVILIFFHQVFTLGDIPFLMIFLDVSVSDLTMAREGGYKLQGGVAVYFWHFSRMVFVPYLVCIAFIFLLQENSSYNRKLFLIVLTVGVLNNALSGAKAPVAMLFMCMFFIFVGAKRNINLKYVVYAIVAVFVFPFLIEYSFSDKGFLNTLEHFTQKVINRFSYETFDRTLSYFDVFPRELEYLGGRTNSLFMLFSQLEYFNVQNYIFIQRIDGQIAKHLYHGSANAHFIGYMNADFGLVGVAFSCLIMGIVIGTIDVYSSAYLTSSKTLAMYMVVAFIFWKLMGSQPTSVLFSHGAILGFLILLMKGKSIK